MALEPTLRVIVILIVKRMKGDNQHLLTLLNF